MNRPMRLDIETVESPDAPIENQRAPRISHLSWIMAELKSDLGNGSANYTVDIMMNREKPGNIWMVFQKGPDGCED